MFECIGAVAIAILWIAMRIVQDGKQAEEAAAMVNAYLADKYPDKYKPKETPNES